jgi:hypothetical protein
MWGAVRRTKTGPPLRPGDRPTKLTADAPGSAAAPLTGPSGWLPRRRSWPTSAGHPPAPQSSARARRGRAGGRGGGGGSSSGGAAGRAGTRRPVRTGRHLAVLSAVACLGRVAAALQERQAPGRHLAHVAPPPPPRPPACWTAHHPCLLPSSRWRCLTAHQRRLHSHSARQGHQIHTGPPPRPTEAAPSRGAHCRHRRPTRPQRVAPSVLLLQAAVARWVLHAPTLPRPAGHSLQPARASRLYRTGCPPLAARPPPPPHLLCSRRCRSAPWPTSRSP